MDGAGLLLIVARPSSPRSPISPGASKCPPIPVGGSSSGPRRLAAAGIVILKDSRSVAAYAANEKLSIGIIGACGQGGSNTKNVASENLVALCDVDDRRADETHKEFPRAKRYVDFHKMLDELHGRLDAVVVSTPDHTHAVAAVAAMKLGKHVYCEKPLTRTVHEAQVMRGPP